MKCRHLYRCAAFLCVKRNLSDNVECWLLSIILKSTHTHINLLGWASLALFGIIYHIIPAISNNMIAKIHFWLFNIGFPLMVAGKIFEQNLGPLSGLGPMLVSIAIILFAINVLSIKKK